jgi:hypothetical protein
VSTTKLLYGANNQIIGITLNSLANNNARQSDSISNTTTLFLDALVFARVSTTSASATGFLNIYAYGTADGGTTYTNNAAGTDSAFSMPTNPNLRLIGVVNVAAANATYSAGPFSVAVAFGGILPSSWGVVIENRSGVTLNSSGHSVFYQGIYSQTV